MDLIDPRGIAGPYSTIAPFGVGATTIAAGSIGWLTTRGDTFVYANTNDRSVILSGADMEIELRGSIALTSASFASF